MNLLSYREIQGLMASKEEVRVLFRECALAILNTGNEIDDVNQILEDFADFQIEVVAESRGPRIAVKNAPAGAFVDGKMIKGVQDHLFSVLRDIVYVNHILSRSGLYELETSEGITEAVFNILRNANIIQPNLQPDLVVCWGGHSIDRVEYEYTKEVGYQLGLRSLNIATGCGPGAMKGPMKGAAIGHSKQQAEKRRYIGITEPGIIAAESPNPIVNELVILPDIEKRLEAFVRLAHSIVVFPGGVGTAEEILYLLSVLMHKDNLGLPFTLILTAPESKRLYFDTLDQFLRATLGDEVKDFYRVIIGDADKVAKTVSAGVEEVRRHRSKTQDAYSFNWDLTVEKHLQVPFVPTHNNMSGLELSRQLPAGKLASEIRRCFSGIVAGNVKAFGIEQVRKFGPYSLHGDKVIVDELQKLLDSFVQQGRMKIDKSDFKRCWELI